MTDVIKSHYKKFKKFSFVGVINTALDFFAFYILHELFGFYYLAAHICSFSIAVINSFILNAVWTFKSFDLKQLPKFIIVSLVGLAISSLVIYFLSYYINLYLAKILSALSALLWNYLGSLFFVFNQKKD